ncbi:hypothetical protein [Calothrix sp. UHCC 0171]|nr:hypothetical protein [Calothrix sp. UHCC 0171]MEA5572691.1 hypothetical protein [Calothrix sp. UHCC 0171]
MRLTRWQPFRDIERWESIHEMENLCPRFMKLSWGYQRKAVI